MNTRILFTSLTTLAGLSLAAHAQLVITSAPNYLITWDGNDGANFDPTVPADVPNNLARASNGATPFASSQLGGIHQITTLNDGLYGNTNSWIGNDGDTLRQAGVLFAGAGTFPITSISFGRDNGNTTENNIPQFMDRWSGVYNLQFTTDDTNWTSIGTVDYQGNVDTILGGSFTGFYRHEFAVSAANGDPIAASGIRLIVPRTGGGGDGNAIDEIEAYSVPEPGSAALLLIGAAALGLRRRKA